MRHLILTAGLVAGATVLHAWDYAGHRMINELALTTLPADFPAFVHEPANAERIAFLAGEPDRWRNTPDLPIKHHNGPDHYLDVEQLALAGLDGTAVSDLRYEFARQFAAGRAAHAGNFRAIDPAKNADRTQEWPGFAPWAITEYYGKLKSAFSYLKCYQEAGTEEEISNAKANILYVMGVMGHYVGDGAQPLHTTMHHHGWEGENPHGYSNWRGLHAWIDGGYIAKAGITAREIQVAPAQALLTAASTDGRDPVFVAVLHYFLAQNAQVEPLYMLEQTGQFKVANIGQSPEGRAFIAQQLRQGAEMLGTLWLTAWREAGPDDYLARQLAQRRTAGSPD